MDDLDRIKMLKQQGFYCSQIILQMGLELQGKTNPDLIRSMHGLAGGVGFTGDICGALTGGVCMLALYAGKGEPEDPEDPRLEFMTGDLVRWFKQEFGQQFGGIRCEELLEGGKVQKSARCPLLVSSTFQKVKEMLVENGFDLYQLDE